MTEIKPCKHCGNYPNMAVNNMLGVMIMYCPICIEGTSLRVEFQTKEKYNVVLARLFENWNAEQEAQQ